MRIGHSYDLHNLIPGKGFKLGGVFVPCDYEIEAVSDGDILYHIISEALIGAIGAGDLGEWFSEKCKGLVSQKMLMTVVRHVYKKGYIINNIDATIVVDEPKLHDYKLKMRDHLVNLLKLPIEQINVKATTTERNHPTFIQGHCVVLLVTTQEAEQFAQYQKEQALKEDIDS